MKIFKTAVKFPAGQGFCNGDPHQTLGGGVAADVGGFGGETQDLLGQGQQLLPLVGQGYGMPDPFKQRDGQLLFQLFDLKGYGGLGITQTSGRQRKALQFVHHNKGFQIFDIHKIIAPSRLSYSINMIKIIRFSNVYENYIMRK